MKVSWGLLCVLAVGCSQPSENAHESKDNAIITPPSAVLKAAASAGPFGIDAGTQLSTLSANGERDAETGVSSISAAPKPSSQFPNVAVVSYPSTGVCEIRSASNQFESDPYIVSSAAYLEEVATALKSKYGDIKVDDGCTGYSCRSDYKLQAIEDGSRWYRYNWKNTDTTKLPNRIKEIYLYVAHSEFNNSMVRLDYVFDNTSECAAAAKSAKASNL